MKILLIDTDSLGQRDVIDAFRKIEKSEIRKYEFKRYEIRRDPEIEKSLSSEIRSFSPDFVFSVNYYPLVSTVCQQEGIQYLSWVYDNPQISLWSSTVINTCNRVFVFDSALYDEFHQAGIQTVQYLPLAVNVERLSRITLTPEEHRAFDAPVSFVGTMYETHNLYDRMYEKLDPYTRGYLDGILQAQLQVQGADLLDGSLTDEIVSRMLEAFPVTVNPDGVETPKLVYRDYFLNRKASSIERPALVRALGQAFGIRLYTSDRDFFGKGVQNMGMANYYETMPRAFKASKINLNITLRSIRKGIPLRCFDIFGAGGFLISNYQEDLLRFFEPGKDFVYYDSCSDLLAKTAWYLQHEDERRSMAESAFRKVRKYHTYEIRLQEMLSDAGIR